MAMNSQSTRLVRPKLIFDLNPVDDGFKRYVQVDHHISRGGLLQGFSLKYMGTRHTEAVLYRHWQSRSSPALYRIGIQGDFVDLDLERPKWYQKGTVLRIRDILVRIRIPEFVPLTNGPGSGSCYFYQ